MKTFPLSELSAELFLQEYWQKKPLLIRQAFPDLTPLLPADELAGLACEEGVESRLIIQEEKSDHWDLQHGPFSEETFSALPEKHWTLLVQAVDHWIPKAAEFIRQFDFIPSWRVDDLMISYASDGGGVGPHYDNYDVFLIQAEGKRQWEIGGKYDQNSSRRTDTQVMILDQWQSKQSWILEPGDMLYLPPQIGHNGIAVSDNCMTYSVGFRAPSHSELLSGFSDAMADRLGNEDRYTDPNLLLQRNPGEITPQALDDIQKILRQYYENPDLISDWFGRYITELKYTNNETISGTQCAIDDLLKHQSEGGIVSRNEGSRFAFIKQNNRITLFVDGETFECDPETNFLAELLCDQTHLDLNQLNGNKACLQLISQLIQQGSLYPEFPG